MNILVLSIGQRPPPWATQAMAHWQKLIPPPFKCTLKHLSPPKSPHTESDKLLQACPQGYQRIALDETGQLKTSQEWAKEIGQWYDYGLSVCFIIGGANGLSAACKAQAQALWSLSPLTFAHPLARVILMEQLYRAISLKLSHPYHRS